MLSLFRSVPAKIIAKRAYQEVKWTRFPLKYHNPSEDTTKMTSLKNGLRVVTQRVEGPTATVGFFIDSGSRAETEKNNGVAHFFEHMAFKGTSKLNQYDMENLVENLGTRLFAYTSREQTVYYGKCFGKDGPKIVEILSDIIQAPLLSQQAIDRERGVIKREMEDIETQIDEVVFDHLHSTAYQGSPLSYTILGPTANVENISRDDLVSYIKEHYTAGRIVLVAVGDVDHDQYVKLAERYLTSLPPTTTYQSGSWYRPATYLGSAALFRNDDMPHAYIAYGYEAVPATHPDFFPLMIASTYIGSWDQSCTNGKVMPTKLAQYVSEHDIIRSYSSFYACYKDTALWGIYYSGKRYQLEHFSYKLGQFLKSIQTNLSDGSVIQAKNALKTNWLMQMDGTTPLFEEIGRQILTYGRRIYDDEFEKLIDDVTTRDVESALATMILGKDPVLAAMGPIEAVPNYLQLRNQAIPLIS